MSNTQNKFFDSMNSPNPNKSITIGRYSDTVAEITADYVGRYGMSFLMSAGVELKSEFDIYLPYNENNYMIGKNEGFYIPETGIIFEYDGSQHFESIEYYGGEEKFIKQIRSDKEKNSYCQNNNIKLVRIPYTSKTITDIKRDIISALKNTDTFILTGDYPQLGWNQK
jgi:hypothetical protein